MVGVLAGFLALVGVGAFVVALVAAGRQWGCGGVLGVIALLGLLLRWCGP